MSIIPPKLAYVNNRYLKKDRVLKRAYQLSIFATCAKTNCLVVVPTGLGKTLIALLLSIHRMIEIPDSKIIFLAPTRPLVDQHLRTYRELTLFEEDQLVVLTGSIPPPKREQMYKNASLFFMTPQVLQNDLIGSRIQLKEVSLIIYDEAHRATGDYSYVFLAKKYKQQNPKGKNLAMTASPGKNREKIEEVMQNLYLDAIEIRTEDDPDVIPYIQEVETIWKEVYLPPEMLDIFNIFNGMMKTLGKDILKAGLLDDISGGDINRRDLLSATNKLDSLIQRSKGGSELSKYLYLKKELSNAIRISHMQELIEAQGLLALKAFIDKSNVDIEEGKGGKSLRELLMSPEMQKIQEKVNNLAFHKVDHPKIAVLLSILQEEFTNSDQSRILLFCHFRDTVSIIVDEINKSPLIRAERFVGQQLKGHTKGLTQKQQLDILQRFKEGVFNVLVATSVAEEGLDISECDVVIFYDIVPSEIRAIQRRGRTGRNRKGKIFLLKTKGTREEGYFWVERRREKEMKNVLKELRRELILKYSPTLALQRSAADPSQRNLIQFIQPTTIQKQSQNEISDSNSTGVNENIVDIDPQIISENIEEKINERDENMEEHNKNYENIPPCSESQNNKTPSSNDLSSTELPKNPSAHYVLIDSRETASPVARELSELNASIELKQLPCGDYIVSDRVGIERKAIPDFVMSLKDGRLFDELIRLRAQFLYPILILEGELSQAISIPRPALLGALTTILLKLNIILYQTKTPTESAEIILALAKKEQGDSPKKISIRFKKIPSRIQQQLEFILAGIPGINTTRARELLTAFHTLRNLFNADQKALEQVPNIGPKIAESITHYATTPYDIPKSPNSVKNEKET